ncbi:shikimate dehydrogenase [Clostridium sp. CAG:1013]|nr:shikimate dehydrogenase [Clostridium sp. CAG:1013]
MLVYQAVAAHEIWYGVEFQKQDLDALCADAQEEMTRLFPGNETAKEEQT